MAASPCEPVRDRAEATCDPSPSHLSTLTLLTFNGRNVGYLLLPSPLVHSKHLIHSANTGVLKGQHRSALSGVPQGSG
ncbi:hypothetical protein J6590_021396 [Homalodisca vitripennis]|nr:hypothetical protein J6590_021396 [Homalodisca vitripennis]